MKNQLSKKFLIKITKHLFIVYVILFSSHIPVHANDRNISPKNVLSVVTAEWNGDGSFDRAVLILSEKDGTHMDGGLPQHLLLRSFADWLDFILETVQKKQ